jgi:hypothetical protein
MAGPSNESPVETSNFGVLPLQVFVSTLIRHPPGTPARPRPDRVILWPVDEIAPATPTDPERSSQDQRPSQESKD